MKINKLVVYTNKDYEEEMALVNYTNSNVYDVLITGDYYHDKINDKIEGYLIALSHLKRYDVDDVVRIIIGRDSEMYKFLGFYDKEEENS